MTDYIKREDAIKAFDPLQRQDWYTPWIVETLEDLPSADVVAIDTVSELFNNEAPCNYGIQGVSIDDFMYKECGDWCAGNCGKVLIVECWKHFLKAWEENKKEWLNEFKD